MNNPESKKFIYVFSKKDYETMLSLGYTALKEDIRHNIFIFLYPSENRHDFSLEADMTYCLSDTLMF